MRLPDSPHISRPWRIHDLTRVFRLEDIWASPTPGGPAHLPRLVAQFAAGDTSDNPPRVATAASTFIAGYADGFIAVAAVGAVFATITLVATPTVRPGTEVQAATDG